MIEFKKYFLKSVKSTNQEVKKYRQKQNFFQSIALLTEIQTKGRGRGTNIWISNKGDLICSFLINEDFNAHDFGKINIIVTVLIIRTLKQIFNDLNFKIKWPNDIYLEEKKIGGILIENSIKNNIIEYIVIGFGFNIITSPSNLKYKTTRILDYQKKIEPDIIFMKLVEMFEMNSVNNLLTSFEKIKNEWLSFSKDLGKEIRFFHNNSYINGKIVSVSNEGELKIKTNNDLKIIRY